MARRAPKLPEAEVEKKLEEVEARKPYQEVYRVTGHKAINGKRRGEIVELEMTPDQISVLVGAGHIALLDEDDSSETVAATDEAATEERV